MTDPRLEALLEARPLTRSERHLVGDHRRCPPGCKRHGEDDRIHALLHDSLMGQVWAARIYTSPAEDEEYLRANEGTFTVRSALRTAFPWLRA